MVRLPRLVSKIKGGNGIKDAILNLQFNTDMWF